MAHDPMADHFYLGRAASYTPSDKQLDAKLKCPWPVIVSMTTSPSRINHVRRILSALHPGSYDAIEINLPKVFART
jgi:hypothetical protein